MIVGECTVCGREAKRLKGTLCEAHYYRQRRTGTTGAAEIADGTRGCSVEGCDGKHRARGLCDKHYQRLKSYGTTELLGLPSGENHPKWAGDNVGYWGAHIRVRKYRGKASEYTCECGNQAEQWAAIHEKCESAEDGMPYSSDWNNYKPMCIGCHKKMDLEQIEKG